MQTHYKVENTKTETKDKIGGSEEQTTTYTYTQEWTEKPVNSAEFKDPDYQNKNIVLTTIENKSITATDVSFGAYKLPDFIISSIRGKNPVKMQLNPEEIQKWNKHINKDFVTDSTSLGLFHINENVAYIGQSSAQPQIGDVRITVEKTNPGIISILAKVNGNTFERYLSKNGKDISKVTQGTVSAENMFASSHSGNSMFTWMFRLAGLILIIIALRMIFGIIETLFKVLPFLANIVGVGIGLVTTIVGFAWTLLIVAIAWMFYRPFIALALIAVIIGAIFFLKQRAAKAKKQATN